MRVLIACECSGVIREAFLAKGHDAYSCDLQRRMEGYPCSDPKRHIVGDALPLLKEKWDLIIAHPPCTFLSVMTACHKRIPGRWEGVKAACAFFREFLYTNCHRICIENSIPRREATDLIGHRYTQLIQPWMFGHSFQKATCLWLRNLPRLKPTNIVHKGIVLVSANRADQQGNRIIPQGMDKRYPSEMRQKIRSVTFQGIAEAMADQWGKLGPYVRRVYVSA